MHATLHIALIAVLSPVALPQDAPPDSQERRLQDLEARLRALEADRQQDDAEAGWYVGYDHGFVLRSRAEDTPFSLRVNGRMQFRYTGVAMDEGTYQNLETAATGTPVELEPRSDFEIERGRLEFRATFRDPRLHMYVNLDGDTDDGHVVIFHDFWVAYDVSRTATLYMGKAFVPGSRAWLDGSTRTALADRTMATTFFRPDRSVGIWVIGAVGEDLNYRAMVGNGFNTTDLRFDDVNRDFAYSGSVWFDPGKTFGSGYADLAAPSELRYRVGASLTYSRERGASPGIPSAESNYLRLDDGSRLVNLGIDHGEITLLAVDAAMKFAGFSLHGEGYYRWLNDLGPSAPGPAGFPLSTNESRGGYLTAGYMLVPERFELVLSTSTVQGDFKDTWEYAGGVNWYVAGAHENKVTLDVTTLDGSPASNSGPNYRVGDDGTMVRLQHQVAF